MLNPDPSPAARSAPARPRLVLMAVIGAFVLPIALAWAAAFGFIPGWVSGQVNRGELLPAGTPLPLEAGTSAPLEHSFGQWSLVVLTAPDCARPCLFDDDMLHRFALAIAADGERVFIYRAGDHPRQPPGIRSLPMSEPERSALVGLTGGAPVEALIIDYQRRPVLVYPAPAEPAHVLKDLRRLLRASRAP